MPQSLAKMILLLSFTILLAPGCGRLGGSAAPLYDRAEILALMHKTNDWQQANLVRPPDNRNWERATWYTGVMAAYKATGDKAFLQQALDWGRQHDWQVGTEKSGANVLTAPQTWLELFFIVGDFDMIAPTIAWVNSGAPNTMTGAEIWYMESGRRYCDSLYVGPPTLAMLARATGDPRYLAAMHAFFWDVTGELWDDQESLYYRDHRYNGQLNENGRKILWSRGNGWVFAGLPRILEYLPADDPQRERYIDIYRRMAASIAKRQGPDGFWRPNLGDPTLPPMPESSGTGFFCYGLAWGINEGLLDRETYLPVVRRAWTALVGAVSEEGKVQWGQLVAAQPNPLTREDTHEYVTGTFLLAASEVYKLSER